MWCVLREYPKERTMMIAKRLLVVMATSVPLAGCMTLPPKPLPDWAMSPRAAPVRTSQSKAAAPNTVARRVPEYTGSVLYTAPTGAPEHDVLPFSPEWQAREDAFENKLRRTMSICRGC